MRDDLQVAIWRLRATALTLLDAAVFGVRTLIEIADQAYLDKKEGQK